MLFIIQKAVETNKLNYMDPGNLAFNGKQDAGQSSQPTEYAHITGVMQEMDA